MPGFSLTLTNKVSKVLTNVLIPEKIFIKEPPIMGLEDFSHDGNCQVDLDGIALGVEIGVTALLQWLKK